MGGNQSKKKRADDTDVDEDPKLWGNKFDALIQSPKGRNVFKNFCEENSLSDAKNCINLWIICESYNKESKGEQRIKILEPLISKYLTPGEEEEVACVDAKTISKIKTCKGNNSAPVDLLKEVQQQIETQLSRDKTYEEFLKSDMYKELVNSTKIA